jgi:hypothetical protein
VAFSSGDGGSLSNLRTDSSVELPKRRPYLATIRLTIPPGDFDSAPEFVDAEEPDSDISDGCRRVEPQMYAEGAVTTCANRTLALEFRYYRCC